MSERTIEDRLREEYVDLLPDLVRTCEHLESKLRYALLPVAAQLRSYESMIVRARVKDCNSAIDSLRRRGTGGVFDRDSPGQYTLLSLKDLAGVRVLAFPSERVAEIDRRLQTEFADWVSDPVLDRETGKTLASKYHGRCEDLRANVPCEYQVASILTGLFWEVEHAAIYKPVPSLKGLLESPVMQARTSDVYRALAEFEAEFERRILQGVPGSLLDPETGVDYPQ